MKKLVIILSFLIISHLASANTNLEVKLALNSENIKHITESLAPYYSETLVQTDTYFSSKNSRLKLREEEGKAAYFVKYTRPDTKTAKESDYEFYPVPDVNQFFAVFGANLHEELKIKKHRKLYLPKPYIRVHVDTVEKLGNFLEVEIILSNKVSLKTAKADMAELENWLGFSKFKKIDCGYRELYLASQNKDFNFYKNQNKIFWVIADDLAGTDFKRYDVIPCIFVEQFKNGDYGIVQLDPSIAHDNYQYTAWRKLIGQEHNFKAEVLLIDTNKDKLYTLKGEEVKFESLLRSNRQVDKSYLAKFASNADFMFG